MWIWSFRIIFFQLVNYLRSDITFHFHIGWIKIKLARDQSLGETVKNERVMKDKMCLWERKKKWPSTSDQHVFKQIWWLWNAWDSILSSPKLSSPSLYLNIYYLVFYYYMLKLMLVVFSFLIKLTVDFKRLHLDSTTFFYSSPDYSVISSYDLIYLVFEVMLSCVFTFINFVFD